MAGGVDEVESKHPVPDPAALTGRLGELGFVAAGPVQEQLDEYYDTPGGQLRGQDLVARLRVVAGAATAGFKGPRTHADDGTYRRVEVEFPADAAGVRVAFAQQGLELVWRLAKRRREFRRGDLVVALDELPLLGTYVEFEGPPALITTAREQVAGLIGAPEPRNYAELAAARIGAGARELLFS